MVDIENPAAARRWQPMRELLYPMDNLTSIKVMTRRLYFPLARHGPLLEGVRASWNDSVFGHQHRRDNWLNLPQRGYSWGESTSFHQPTSIGLFVVWWNKR